VDGAGADGLVAHHIPVTLATVFGRSDAPVAMWRAIPPIEDRREVVYRPLKKSAQRNEPPCTDITTIRLRRLLQHFNEMEPLVRSRMVVVELVRALGSSRNFAQSRPAIQWQTVRLARGSTAMTLGVTLTRAEGFVRQRLRVSRPRPMPPGRAFWSEIASGEIARILA
jgi:hypothetical protein